MSEDTQPEVAPEQAPAGLTRESIVRFKREAWWQVTFPVVVVAILSVAGLVLLIVLGGRDSISVVADYSLVLLLIPVLLGGLLILALGAVLIYVISALIRAVPPYTGIAQQRMEQIHRKVDEITDWIAGIVISARSLLAGLNVYLRQAGAMPDVEPGQPETKPDQEVT